MHKVHERFVYKFGKVFHEHKPKYDSWFSLFTNQLRNVFGNVSILVDTTLPTAGVEPASCGRDHWSTVELYELNVDEYDMKLHKCECAMIWIWVQGWCIWMYEDKNEDNDES